MGNIADSINKHKAEERKNVQKFEKSVKNLHEHRNLEQQTEKKLKVINYYNNLSDADKYAFNQELKKKKVRESYLAYLKYVYGDNYIPTNFHRFLAKVCETVVKRIEEGKKIKIALSVPPQHGKGYPTDFPILTTKGWKNHGDLQVGDYVYNDKGEQVMVLGTQTPYMHECLKISFSTGEEHIITKEHLWKVLLCYETRRFNGIKRVHSRERRETIIETQKLMELMPKQKRNPSILINQPLQNEEKLLPLNPYILGLWLGDGCSNNNEIVVSDKDLADLLLAIGEKETYSIFKQKRETSITYIKFGKQKSQKNRSFKWDFSQKLNDMGIRKNKHIPIDYLLASEEQRWELLRGLMDTDGTCNRNGDCEYCGINKKLTDDVFTLCRSLGIKANILVSDAKLYGRVISKKYRITFRAEKGKQYFNLQRKQNRINQKEQKERKDKCQYFITSIVPVDDKLVSCISVEGGMYLAGKGLIPTHNSTTISETLPSWFIGRNPDLRCICTGYNADMAEKIGDRNREKVKKYGKDLFGIEISDSQDNKTLWNIKDHLGGLYSAGITGGLTGNQGALIIIDDPFKNGIEAKNPTIRDNIWQIFCDSVLTRQRGNGNAIIVIHTRWHEDDLIGRIIKNDKNNEWLVINIPCIAEENDRYLHRKQGETLCPELGFDAQWVENIKSTIGKETFNALYQGKPYIDGGNIIKRDDIMHYTHNTLPEKFDEIVLSCDLSFGGTKKTSDPYCMTLWGRVGGNHYLLKVLDKKATFTETNNTIRHLCNEYPELKKKIIEAKANGNSTVELLNKEIGGFIPFDPKGESKEMRLSAVSPFFEAHNVFFPDESVFKDIADYEQELLKFPNATHDDFVDTISQYLLNYEYRYGGKVSTESSLGLLAKAIRGF